MVFPLGLFLGYLYQKSGKNLLSPIAFHIAVNASGLFVLSYSNAQTVALGLDYGLIILLSLVRVAVVGALVWATIKTKFFKSALGSRRQ